MVNLKDTRPTVNQDLPSQSDIVKSGRENSPELPVLIAEVDQTGSVEKELDEIVQHQQDQTQAVQTEGHRDAINVSYDADIATTSPFVCVMWRLSLQNVGACNMDQVQEDVDQLAWNVLLHAENGGAEDVNIYSSLGPCVNSKECNSLKQCKRTEGSQTGYTLRV